MPIQEIVQNVPSGVATALGSNGTSNRYQIIVTNQAGGGVLRLGGPGATASNGFTLASNTTITIPCPQSSVYAISESGTNVVRVLEIS